MITLAFAVLFGFTAVDMWFRDRAAALVSLGFSACIFSLLLVD